MQRQARKAFEIGKAAPQPAAGEEMCVGGTCVCAAGALWREMGAWHWRGKSQRGDWLTGCQTQLDATGPTPTASNHISGRRGCAKERMHR